MDKTKVFASAIALFFSFLFSSTLTHSCAGVPCKPETNPNPLPPPKDLPANPFCPRDTLKLGACADLLGGLFHQVIGSPPSTSSKCCTLLDGLVDSEAAACLCTVIKENVLGLNVEWSVALSLLVSSCEKSVPPGFKCV
uniref:Bifunctional inhibitor/plant lipid transfer protein/seed storage helical domain-containing protein n=1 Tax=Nelumbo nucifera TaxID=4432 RepID=A0A822ZJU1_NELNU|nr:TPA_asm: hypothetical protein HUJ06_003223 [Nelumbo nucifera]